MLHPYWFLTIYFFQQIAVECDRHLLHGVFSFLFCQVARPYHNNLPTCLHQKAVVPLVTFTVAVNFRLPESRVGLRHHKLAASFMSVPKATIDKDSRPVSAHHDIRLSRHTPDVESVSVSVCPQPFPDQQFRFRRLATDMRHTAVTLFFGQLVHINIRTTIISIKNIIICAFPLIFFTF